MRPTLPPHAPSWLRRRSARLLAGTTIVITSCLIAAVPAQAEAVSGAPSSHAAHGVHAAHAAHGSAPVANVSAAVKDARAARAAGIIGVAVNAPAAAMQTVDISTRVAAPAIVTDSFEAVPPNVPKVLHRAAPAATSGTVTSTSAALGAAPGERLKVVGAALSYLGVPYVFGGASRSGVDCSGLIMDAYAAIGISLAHYVPSQDAAGTQITEAEAQPGDLVVFDNEEHIAMYLGNGKIVAAPAPGRNVEIESLSEWSGIAYHFTRVLPN
jgi:cell wall-associated NlpC family hydrolase